jgi:GT2 family glycosyltransferase
MKNQPKVSIIIPVIAVNDYIRESIPEILKLDWPDYEIFIFPDQPDKKHKWPKTKIIASGKVGPAEKRDLAIKYAQGEIIAFLDDDAFPRADWLKKSIKLFSDKKVGAVGGPAMTPKHDDTLQKVSGAVFESYLGGGGARNRYWPTVNLLFRKDVFAKIGGFDNTYWPGEDTKLCLDILSAGYKIMYTPEAVVYHHRRSDLVKHFKQIGNYALHRGFFAKIYPKTSLKLFYFMPSIFDLYLLALIIITLIPHSSSLVMIASIPIALYAVGLILDALVISFRWKNPLVGLITIPMVLFTHVWYGIRFVWGLIIPKLAR